MIIDEVDVFFDQNYYGNTYCPAITLDGPEIMNLLHFVWKSNLKE